ncbi:replication initiation protein [uncultured Clostridium sp.]|uniref:replication initiation protein n=1 Tax=uncultured Clostridium sp. TaxID=59620 RepID=UPI002730BDC5|nr:replication initiation protein [uncultured Clostridium sp.]
MINNEILFKPNSLILASANKTITSSEFKLYDTLLQRCQITKNPNWRNAKLTRKEIKSIITNNDKTTIDEIKKILDKFIGINIKFKLGRKDYSATLISEYIYDNDLDTFDCSMSENVYMALMRYSEFGYSPIDLKMVRQAKGFYTQKIYQLLRTWSRNNTSVTKVYSIEQIKEICDIFPGTAYDVYGNLKKKVLVPAIKEINEKLNMKVEFEELKSGRKITQIKFICTDFETRKYEFNNDDVIVELNEVSEENSLIKLLKEYSLKPIAVTTLKKLEKEYSIEILEKAICIMGENNRKKRVIAPVKYLKSILKNIKESNFRINPKSFNNFEAGTSEEKLKLIEEELLYGSKKEELIDENINVPECLKKFLEEKINS